MLFLLFVVTFIELEFSSENKKKNYIFVYFLVCNFLEKVMIQYFWINFWVCSLDLWPFSLFVCPELLPKVII